MQIILGRIRVIECDSMSHTWVTSAVDMICWATNCNRAQVTQIWGLHLFSPGSFSSCPFRLSHPLLPRQQVPRDSARASSCCRCRTQHCTASMHSVLRDVCTSEFLSIKGGMHEWLPQYQGRMPNQNLPNGSGSDVLFCYISVTSLSSSCCSFTTLNKFWGSTVDHLVS